MKKLIAFAVSFLFFCFFFEGNVKAIDYNFICMDEIHSNKSNYKLCGRENIFLINDKQKSSYFISTLDIYGDEQTLYAGKVDGVDTFYTLRFFYYSMIYDDRGASTSSNNYWSDIILNNVLIYSGEIKDNFFVNQTKRERVVEYALTGTYLIRQHVGSKIIKTIRIIIPEKKDYGMSIDSAMYGDKDIGDSNLIEKNKDLIFAISGGEYGFLNNVEVSVNECSFNVAFEHLLKINNNHFAKCLKYNENNKVSLVLYNGFNQSKQFKYSFMLHSNKVSIKLENSVSAIETSSRRILIQSYAGNGKQIDEQYNLYYWSKNANDALTYKDFLSNYETSEYKGVYTNNRGVILRDEEGTYYLYALAKDDDSTIVVRSDKYILKEKDKLNRIVMNDVFFVIGLIVLAIIPIWIYLVIRGKDTK